MAWRDSRGWRPDPIPSGFRVVEADPIPDGFRIEDDEPPGGLADRMRHRDDSGPITDVDVLRSAPAPAPADATKMEQLQRRLDQERWERAREAEAEQRQRVEAGLDAQRQQELRRGGSGSFADYATLNAGEVPTGQVGIIDPEAERQRQDNYARRSADDDSLGAVATKFFQNLPERAQRWVAGLAEAGTHLPRDPVTVTMDAVLGRSGLREKMDEAIRSNSREVFNQATEELRRNAPNLESDSAALFAYDAANAFLDMGVAAGASVLTRSPSVGAAVMGGQVFGDKFGESRSAGRTAGQSFADASVYGAAEFIGEKVVLGKLMKPGGSFLGRVGGTAATEAVQEAVTQVIQDGYDSGIIGEDMSWGEAFGNMVRAGLIGGVVGGGVGAATHPLEMRAQRREQGRAVLDQIDSAVFPVDEAARRAFQPGDGSGTAPPLTTRRTPTVPGKVETAHLTVEPITPEDEQSPLPTELIAQGRAAAADAKARYEADTLLAREAAPAMGSRVSVEGRTATVVDAFDDGEAGITLRFESGQEQKVYLADLRDAGIDLRRIPEQEDRSEHVAEGPLSTGPVPRTRTGNRVSQSGDTLSRMVPITLGAESGNRDHDAAGNVVTSPAGAKGRMQVLDGTNTDPGFGVRPAANDSLEERARVGRDYLAAMMRRYSNDPAKAWAAYNAGPGRVDNAIAKHGDSWLAQMPAETRSYVANNVARLGGTVSDSGPVNVEELSRAERAEQGFDFLNGDLLPGRPSATLETSAEPEPVRLAEIMAREQPAPTPQPEPSTQTSLAVTEQELERRDLAPASALDMQIRDEPARPRPTINVAGSSVVITDLPETERTRIEAKLPGRTRLLPRNDGAFTVPKRYEAAVRAAIEGDGTRAAPAQVREPEDLERIAGQVNTDPTEAQIESGNYKKAHLKLHGLDITVENPKGSERRGVDADGKPWSVTMPASYGYLKRTTGADEEQIDTYIGPLPSSPLVFVVDQVEAGTGKWDEHKVMLGYPSKAAALESYKSGFSDGRGEERIGGVTTMSVPQFREWLKTEQTAPVTETSDAASASESTIISPTTIEAAKVIEPTDSAQSGLEMPQTAASAPADTTIAQAPIVRYRQEAAKVEANMSSVADGMTRLWRGEREGADGKGLNFTNDLPGIALPYRDAYGGNLNHVDVPTVDLPKYEMTGAAATGAEFHLPADMAAKAVAVAPPESTGAPAASPELLPAFDQAEPQAAAAPAPESEDSVDEIVNTTPINVPRGAMPDEGEGGAKEAAEPPAEEQQAPRLSISEPVAKLTGQEFPVRIASPADMPALRQAAVDFYTTNLLGKSITTSDGRKVSFAGRGLRKTTSKGETLLRAVPAIRAILEKGRLIQTRPGRDIGTKAMHLYSATVELAGQSLNLGVFVRETPEGHFHYDLTKVDVAAGAEPTQRADPEGGARESRSAPALDSAPDSDLNIIDLGNRFNEDDLDRVRAGLEARIGELGLSEKVGLHLVDTLFDDPRFAGQYLGGIVTVAMRSSQPAEMTLNHEIVHALKDLGLFRAPEWTTLRNAALADTRTMAAVGKRYAEQGLSQEQLIEEAVADRFAAWAQERRQEKGFVRAAFERIRDFFRLLGDALRGRFSSAEAVMRGIEAGEIGRREEVVDLNGEPRLSIADDAPGALARWSNTPADSVDSHRNAIEALGERDPGKMRETWEGWRSALQDRMLPLLRTQQQIEALLGRPLAEEENAYLGEELMTGKVGARLELLAEDLVDPLFEALKTEKISAGELESYLYARHAPERNARIAEINPEFSDGGGSGMTDIEARAILARIRKAGRIDAFERVAEHVDAILRFATDTRVEAGLLSQDEAEAWRSQYRHYVPLRGRAEIEEDPNSDRPRRGSGINVRGKESQRAFGRRSKADDILAYTLLQAEEAIVRAETNRVGQQFHALAVAAPDPDFWTIDKITRKPSFNEASGQVQYRVESRIAAEDAPFTVSLKIGGEEHRVTLNRGNPAAVRLADAMRNLSGQQFHDIVRFMGKFTRAFSAINTRYSPPFMIVNAVRDVMTASVTLQQHDIPGLVGGTLRDWHKALRAPSKGDGEWAKWRREFELSGGKIFFNDLGDINQLRKRIERQMARSSRVGVVPLLGRFFDVVEAVNGRVENAVRLAAYKNAREAGLTKGAAASLARNATVNFTRRGKFSPVVNAGYAFFNAATQGSATLIMAAMRSRRVQASMMGFVVAGFAMDMLNSLAGDDDDDGESLWSKVPEHEKERNLILMLPGTGGKSLKLPLGLGLNALFNIGRLGSEVTRGAKDPLEGATGAITGLVDAFNPLGGGGSWVNLLLPSIFDPLAEIGENRNFAGKPIQPEQSPYEPSVTPSSNYFPSVNPIAKSITDTLNRLTGGDDIQPGGISVSPEVVEYLTGFFTGGAGRFLSKTAGLAFADEPIGPEDIPIVDRVVGGVPDWQAKSAFYARIDDIEQAVDYAKDYEKAGDRAGLDRLISERIDVLGLEPLAKAARKEMRAIRQERLALETAKERGEIGDDGFRVEREILDGAESAVISGFNREYLASVKKPKGPK